MSTKVCTSCGIERPLSEYRKRHDRPVGIRTVCKTCDRAAAKIRDQRKLERPDFHEKRAAYIRSRRSSEMARARERRHAEKYRERYPEKSAAKQLLAAAVKRGDIVRPEVCEHCGGPAGETVLHGHHTDYSRPLDVQWLCRDCHIKEHRARATATPGEG